jgi:hypothetical protein
MSLNGNKGRKGVRSVCRTSVWTDRKGVFLEDQCGS